MANRLEPILLQKQREIAVLCRRLEKDTNHPIAQILRGELQIRRSANFKDVLKSTSLTVIAEIKRKSPSKGVIASITDPTHLAHRYILGGANALSILTDKEFFGGHIDDLTQVADTIHNQRIPIIRKDFIIDKVQIAEAAAAGASAVLLIVAVLGKKTKALLEFARSIKIDTLVEIHDHDELKIALDCGAEIIGINNRNLNTFAVDTQRAIQIVSAIPNTIIKVAESGITSPVLARQYYQAGFDAVLIGEALVKSDNPEHFIQECRHG
jgi:indole-3-glycerol phosphate synthase